MFVEDDDFYHPQFLAETVRRLEGVELVGGIWQPYYNVNHRVWKLFRNRGSCLCQTGMHATLVPLFLRVLDFCEQRATYGVDGNFWKQAKEMGCKTQEYEEMYVVGIKGIEGQPGLGVGHRPKPGWAHDPQMVKLKEWVGADWPAYAGFYCGGRA